MTAPHTPMMNDDGLLECPFCGEVDEVMIGERLSGETIYHLVVCGNCWCETGNHYQLDTAIEIWNTRGGHLYTAEDFNQAAEERDYGL